MKQLFLFSLFALLVLAFQHVKADISETNNNTGVMTITCTMPVSLCTNN